MFGAVTLQAQPTIPQQAGFPVGPPWVRAFSVGDVAGDGCQEIIAYDHVLEDLHLFDCTGALSASWIDAIAPHNGLPDSTMFGDIDGDGQLEMVFKNNNSQYWIYALEMDGTPVPGWPFIVGDGGYITRIAVTDVTGDGVDEIIVLDVWNATIQSRVWVYDGTGTPLPGWPQVLSQTGIGLAVGDLEFDGSTEIVVSTGDRWDPYDGPHPIYVFNSSGDLRLGWPVTLPIGPGTLATLQIADLNGDYSCEIIGNGYGADDGQGSVEYVISSATGEIMLGPIYGELIGTPAIGNLDEDDDLEIVFPSMGIHVWDLEDGLITEIQGGPAAYGFGGVVLADIDGDDISEIAVQSSLPARLVHLMNASLEPLHGFPYEFWPSWSGGPQPNVFTDLDGDGDIELLHSDNGVLRAWDIPNPSGQPTRIDWSRWSGDEGRSNYYHLNRFPDPRFLRGDVDGDGDVVITDVVGLLAYLFGGNPDHSCPARTDFDDDEVADIADAVALLQFLFLGGPPPAAPFPECRQHPGGTLGCALEPCP